MTLSSITARNRSARDKKRAVFLTGVLQEKRLSFYLADVILVNIFFRIVRKKASVFLPMSTMATGKMLEHLVLTGKQIWS